MEMASADASADGVSACTRRGMQGAVRCVDGLGCVCAVCVCGACAVCVRKSSHKIHAPGGSS